MDDERTARGRERLAIAILTIAAAVLRFWSFGRFGLSHFDEGIYAFSGLWAVSPRGLAALDPGVVPYAPPGFPVLVGLSYALFGVSDSAAILAALVCGIATIPIAGWVGSKTFGSGGGVAAAAFAALSLPAIAFSRKALTDAPFLLCWLAGIVAVGRFLERPGLGRALGLGGAVAIAQYFKYNGWLLGAITIVAALSALRRDPEARRRESLVRTLGFGFVAALTAAALYAPWVLFVEAHGGYAALLRHHRSYAGGLSSWWPHWKAQIAQAHALSGAPVWPAIGWAAAWTATRLATVQGVTDRHPSRAWFVGLAGGAAALAAVPSLAWWVGLAALPLLLTAREPAHHVLASWWLLMSFLTPFYHPYARLWLPTQAAGWILAAGVVEALTGPSFARRKLAPTGRPRLLITAAAACATAAAIQVIALRPVPFSTSRFLAPGPSLRAAAFDLAASATREPDAKPLFLLARRPLAFYLALAGRPVVLLPDLSPLLVRPRPDRPALVDEALVRQEGEPLKVMARLEPAWTVARRFEDRADPVTLLDVLPRAAFDARAQGPLFLWLMTPNRRTPSTPSR